MKKLFAISGVALALLVSACATGQTPKSSVEQQLKQEVAQELKGS